MTFLSGQKWKKSAPLVLRLALTHQMFREEKMQGDFRKAKIEIEFFSFRTLSELTQLAHDVVTTLVFGCLLVVTSLLPPKSNVVTASCFRRRFSDQILTL